MSVGGALIPLCTFGGCSCFYGVVEIDCIIVKDISNIFANESLFPLRSAILVFKHAPHSVLIELMKIQHSI